MKFYKLWKLLGITVLSTLLLTGCGGGNSNNNSGGGNTSNNPPAWNISQKNLQPNGAAGQTYQSSDLNTYLTNDPAGTTFSVGSPTDAWLTVSGNFVVSVGAVPTNVNSGQITVIALNPATNESTTQTFTLQVSGAQNVQPKWISSAITLTTPALSNSPSYQSEALEQYIQPENGVDVDSLVFTKDSDASKSDDWLDVQPVTVGGKQQYAVVLAKNAKVPSGVTTGTVSVIATNNLGTASAPAKLTVSIIKVTPSMKIKGWPNYLAMGTITNNDPSVTATLNNAMASHPLDFIFSYPCIQNNHDCSSDGDTLDQIKANMNATFVQATALEGASSTGSIVTPLFIISTVVAIPGSDDQHQAENDLSSSADGTSGSLPDHYNYLIQMTKFLQSQKNANHPNPASIILNPNLLPEMEAGQDPKLQPTATVNVNKSLAFALQKNGFTPQQLNNVPQFANTVAGYMQSINWIIKTFSPDVPFGWHEGIWANDKTGYWLHHYDHGNGDDDPAKQTDSVVSYLSNTGVYLGGFSPDFIAFDREPNGRDDLYTVSSPFSDMFYNTTDWTNYLGFVKRVSDSLGVAAVLWQIPGGHFQYSNDVQDLTHSSSAIQFFFGAPSNFAVSPSFWSQYLATQGAYNQGVYCGLANVYSCAVSGTTFYAVAVQLSYDGPNAPPVNWVSLWTPHLSTIVGSNVVGVLWGSANSIAVAPLTVSSSTSCNGSGAKPANGCDGSVLMNTIINYYKNSTSLPQFAN